MSELFVEANSTLATPSPSIHENLSMTPKTPQGPFISSIMTPIPSPMKKDVVSMHAYLKETTGHLTELNPQDAWLPITESRKGNVYYAAFHTLISGIGFQALLLPLAFATLGWVWGIISLSLVFMWQLYTSWLLIQLHESIPGTRHSRYISLSMAAFGKKLGKILVLLPTLYLAGGTCVTLIMLGGSTLKIFFQIMCGTSCNNARLLTNTEWYAVFVCLATILIQLPNLNSIAGFSLFGAITAVAYCTLAWVLSVAKRRPAGVSYDPVESNSHIANVCGVLNALGIIAFAFRGHNLVLEIQGTLPSTQNQPSRVPMWRGVKLSYMIIACCLFPMAIGGHWAYGNLVPANGGLLKALDKYHRHELSKAIRGLTTLLVVINCLTSFQIYAMSALDNLESKYTSKKNKPCPRWVRTGIRIFFGCFTFFISVALPFLKSLTGLFGGIALPVTLAYPCFMWIRLRKPEKYSSMWWLNWFLGSLGVILSVLVVFGAAWTIATQGIEVHFFKP